MESLIIEIPSKKSFDETVESILNRAFARNWKNPATHDLQMILRNFGKEVMPVKVIELCRPDYSSKILELNNERSASVFMPCRISVYRKEDGSTWIGLMNAGMMAGMMAPTVAETMIQASDEMIAIVQEAMV